MDKKSRKKNKYERMHTLNVGCCLENFKPLSKLKLHPKSSCLKRLWICYGRQKTITLQQIFSNAQVWAIVKATTSCLNHVITTFIMNQSHGHWLLFDALSTIMTLTIKVKLK